MSTPADAQFVELWSSGAPVTQPAWNLSWPGYASPSTGSPEAPASSSPETSSVSELVDLATARAVDGAIEITLVLEGRFVHYRMPRHVAAALAASVAHALT